VLHILVVCVCSRSYRACIAHAPCYIVICGLSGCHIVTVDPGSNPDHDKLGGEIGKVKCLLGGGGTRRTCKDGTKACYKRSPCRLNPYRQEGDERRFL